jgi:two-component system phosphate regulon response regulator OmpR
MGEQASILVVDDEPEVRDTFAEYLQLRGYRVGTAESGEAMRREMAASRYDLILLDLNMPGEDGLTIARHLRQGDEEVAIIMVTAATEPVDRVIGLEIGADDYLGKPCDLRELLARVRSVLRRSRPEPGATPVADSGERKRLAFGPFVLDVEARRLIDADGEDVTLTGMEFDMLHAFVTRPNRVLSRDQLLDIAHNRDYEPFDRSIDIRIARLRRKIETDPARPRYIKTIRGTGYLFSPDGSPS